MRELGEVTRGDSGEQMVLHVMKHVVGHHVLESPTLRAGDSKDAIAVMVHRPHCEEGRKALADDHRRDVCAERSPVDVNGRGCGQSERDELGENPAPRARAGERPSGEVQTNGERRAAEHGTPPGALGRVTFDIVWGQAVSMMVHMRRLNRVHRTHHGDAQPEHREVSRPSTQTSAEW